MEIQERLARLASEAGALGLDTAGVQQLVRQPPDYGRGLPVLSDLRDAASRQPSGDRTAIGRIRDEADDLIGVLQRDEASVPAPDQDGRDAVARATYGSLQAEYVRLWATCSVRPDHAGEVAWHVRKLNEGRAAYERAGADVGVPWYFVGIVHGLEASFRFSGHLHNGDPLTARTVHVPANRPPVWNPPTDWTSSAVDALTLEGLAHKPDWSIARMLYRWEAYNGFGSRAHGVNTPYLWSFSVHYDRGKYAADGRWDPALVSKQCGAAVMLKALVMAGAITSPAET